MAIALLIPWLPFSNVFGFVPLPPKALLVIVTITVLYVVTTELAKRWFYREPASQVS